MSSASDHRLNGLGRGGVLLTIVLIANRLMNPTVTTPFESVRKVKTEFVLPSKRSKQRGPSDARVCDTLSASLSRDVSVATIRLGSCLRAAAPVVRKANYFIFIVITHE